MITIIAILFLKLIFCLKLNKVIYFEFELISLYYLQ